MAPTPTTGGSTFPGDTAGQPATVISSTHPV